MATWILGIDRENPEHWQLAKEHGFWDVTAPSRRDFAVGDRLCFWQAGKEPLGLGDRNESDRRAAARHPGAVEHRRCQAGCLSVPGVVRHGSS